MPTLSKKLTDTVARSAKDCPVPNKTYIIYWCSAKDGFGVRVSWTGDRAWIFERRVKGKTVRRTIGKAEGRGAISVSAARELAIDRSSELSKGVDRAEIEREERKAEATAKKEAGVTLKVALKEYVSKKRRGKDGLALKERTKADYLAMVEQGGIKLNGEPKQDGSLLPLADTPVAQITADDVRTLFAKLEKRGQRQAVYAMQVLRAVLNWHGVKIPGNPLGKEVAGKDRITLSSSVGVPKPIPPEYLGAWWRAACGAGKETVGGSMLAGDYYRFRLLTGCRGVEVIGDNFGNEPIRVKDVDLIGARIKLADTKNRKDHTLLLSRQAMEIAKRNVEGKKADDLLFAVGDPRKTLQAINVAAGMAPLACQGHDLRDTFASVAEELVSGYTLKRLINHSDAGDVTGSSYVGKGEAQLRAGWQVVADAIEDMATDPPQQELPDNVVPMKSKRKSAA
jgi:integrase